MEIIKLSKTAVNKAVTLIKNGGVVVFPTDTVYGFLADAGNKKAVEKIYKIKKRPKSKPLAVFIKDLKLAEILVNISGVQKRELKKHWPGKYTFILKSKNVLQTPGVYKNNTIALRIPKYKFLIDLLKKTNKPLAQTSVNISGQPELNEIQEIIDAFKSVKNQPDLIVNAGNPPKRKPSKIIDLTGDKIKVLRK